MIRPYLKKGETFSAPAGGLVHGVLSLLGFDPQLYAVFDAWDRETRGLVRGCEATAIQGSRLCVSVPSTAHRQEILYSKGRILQRINQAIGKNMISDIQFELKADSTSSNLTGQPKGGTVREQNKIRLGIERNGKRSG